MKEGWENEKLKRLSKIMYGYTAKASYEIEGVKYLRITDVQNNNVKWQEVPNCKINEEDFTKYQLHYGDIVFARTGATTGKSFLITKAPDSVFASYLIRVQLSPERIIPEFLYLYFQSDSYWNIINKGISGSAQGGFNASKLGELDIPIPPLPEQKQIVTLLDKAFAAINQAKTHIEKNIENAKELFQSKKEFLFKNLSKECKVIPIEEVCEQIFAGGDAPKGNFSKVKTDKFDIPIIANAIKDNGLYGFTNTARVLKPSITVAARGSGTGHTEYRDYPFLPIVRLIVLTPDTSIVNAQFLMHSIKSLIIERSGSAIPQLTVPMMKSYSIPLPDLDTQIRINNSLNNLQLKLDEYKTTLGKKTKVLEELKKSILQKAFSGELTKANDIIEDLPMTGEPKENYKRI